jgi:isoleucyl-tRNA synthetase
MKFKSQEAESVHLLDMPKVDESIDFRSQEPKWQKIMSVRDEVLRVLEGLRQQQKIASNQEASAAVNCDDELVGLINEFGIEQFAALCIVSEVKLQKASGETTVTAEKSSYQKCQRCWNYWQSVGASDKYPDLCKRCVKTVG